MPEPIDLYLGFDKVFFRGPDGPDPEREEALAQRYLTLLRSNSSTINAILLGQIRPNELPKPKKEELGLLIEKEKKFSRELSHRVDSPVSDRISGWDSLTTQQKDLTGRRVQHLVRLMSPAEYDGRFRDFVEEGHQPRYHFCFDFVKDLINYVRTLDVIEESDREKTLYALGNEGQGYYNGVFQFWTLAPYIHANLVQLGCSRNSSIATILSIVINSIHEDHMEPSQVPLFLHGYSEHQLGYDERMPSHLYARMEAWRDVTVLRDGYYETRRGIPITLTTA